MAPKASCWFSRQKPPQAEGVSFLEDAVQQLSFDIIGKVCTKCGKWKPLDYFSKHPSGRYKRQPQCKDCARSYMKVYKLQYRAKNLEKRRAYSRQYYAEHREERLAYHRKWAAENRDVANTAKINYRTRKRDNEGSFTTKEWKDLCEKYGNKCLCCDVTDKPLTVDHVIPIKKGGSSNIENLQPLCKSCNSSKRDKIIDYRY